MKKIRIGQIHTPFAITTDKVSTDKSISHRCAMFSLLCEKPSIIKNFLEAEDTLNSLQIAQKLGATVVKEGALYRITPPKKIQEPDDVLDCGNAGTAIRLYTGLLASQEGLFILSGDKYLRKRPMKRVANPLREIGAEIDGRDNGNLAPLVIRGKKLQSFRFESKIASAQVKSAMILAALNAEGECVYTEPELSRDHTENMLKGLGANISTEGTTVYIQPHPEKFTTQLEIEVPSDPSSAFFFAVAAAIHKEAKVTIKNMLLNKTRIEAFKILEKMGAILEIKETSNKFESIGDVTVVGDALRGVSVEENISWLIDEIPALSIAFACATGKSSVKNAEELRVKESDRIKTTVTNLNKCGIKTNEFEDGFEVFGGELQKSTIDSYGDHRIAMSFAIAGLKCGMEIEDIECINTSFPAFFEILSQITSVQEY